jgi:hypothetical protein
MAVVFCLKTRLDGAGHEHWISHDIARGQGRGAAAPEPFNGGSFECGVEHVER